MYVEYLRQVSTKMVLFIYIYIYIYIFEKMTALGSTKHLFTLIASVYKRPISENLDAIITQTETIYHLTLPQR